MSPAMASAANYYAWIASRFRPVLGHRVLDIGGGHGPHLDHVVDAGRTVVSLDLSPACVAEMKHRFEGRAFDAVSGDITDAAVVESLSTRGFDTVLCVNVLEHIEEDRLALEGMATILRPSSGYLFLLVPAHPSLYGTPDLLAGHVRRYRRRDLRALLADAGFRLTDLSYFNGFGAIPYALNSRIFKPRTLGGAIDTQIVMYDRFFVPALRRLESLIRMPFGQSLIAIAQASRC
jgi:SAM-dependent methyltransferase